MTRICTRCVMDTTDPDIQFDPAGLCNHCRLCDLMAERAGADPAERAAGALDRVLVDVRAAGRGRDYDCVIGLSGGVDSSYLAYVVVREFGLRPLAVHLDNGWDSRVAAGNITRLVKKLGIDLVTTVIDWEEFRDLQRAYFHASVIDIESTTDQAILAVMYQSAADHGIKHILTGTNTATEQILPRRWGFNNNDAVNLADIHRRHGTRPIPTFPLLGSAKLRHYSRELGIVSAAPLDMIPYVKSQAKAKLIEELGWTDYKGKHTESLFTKFYQGYFLVEKFGFDKRRAHLASLINSGQVTRDAALEELHTPAYAPDELERIFEYVTKKLGFTRDEFRRIMAAPPRSNFEYATDFESKWHYVIYPRIGPLYRRVRGVVERAVPAPVVRELRRRVQRLLPR